MDEQKTNAEKTEEFLKTSNVVQKPPKKKYFLKGMILYTLVLALAGAAALRVLWSFLEEYELTRPSGALSAYQEQLTAEHAADLGLWVREQTDGRIQNEEQARQVILDSLDGELRCLKKGRESTEDHLVYAVRCGNRVIGEFSMDAGEPLYYGMRPWAVTEEHFDFSDLISETRSVTVPDCWTVTVNGQVLTEEFQTESGIRYAMLEDYYDTLPMPGKVTYTFGPVLGEMTVEIADDLGEPAEEWQEPIYFRIFDTVAPEDRENLESFTDDFIRNYVAFLGSSKYNRIRNYKALMDYVVEDSELAQRLHDALDGLQYGWSVEDTLASIARHFQMEVQEGLWLSDLTYEVDTLGQKGVVRTTTNVRLLIEDNGDGMRVRAIEVY